MKPADRKKNLMDEDDAALLSAYRNGDAEALGRLVEKYKRPLFSFILRFSAGREEADDLFQEVWVRAIHNMNRYRQKNLLSWLFRIAHNLIIDRVRRRRPLVPLDAPFCEGGIAPADYLAGNAAGPDRETDGRALGARIAEAAACLPVEQQEVFWLRMQAGLSFKEIARVQHCSINTALARMQYALAKLRRELAVEYDELRRAGA